MEISSLSASTIPSLNTPNSTSNYSSKISSFSSLQFPVQLHRLRFRKRWITSPSRPPILPLINTDILEVGYEAKVPHSEERISKITVDRRCGESEITVPVSMFRCDYTLLLTGFVNNIFTCKQWTRTVILTLIELLTLALCDAFIVAAKKQTFSTLDELLEKSDKPVLVDFYATWCGPCQFMAPILNEVSAVLEDTVQMVKIDTEKYPSIADKYRIEALPTFIIFKDGKPYDRFVTPKSIQYEASVFGFFTADRLPHSIRNFCFKTALLELKFQRLAVSDPESCCKKLGDLLSTGLLDEHSEAREGKSPLNFRLHSVHRLALSTDTTLTSAYAVRASDLFALHSEVSGHPLEVLSMSRSWQRIHCCL
ncbi:hypothetical protein POTOM_009713 [Populus tomentosa]|uniref:Thioredoxin domain-containing protein n=1 Tax=Populus tomentosa TaxID=118781 RepID=A0A8X8ANB0_POPTO|nr:hypothetical protein POTOM_009713 [Populus tomentosa]